MPFTPEQAEVPRSFTLSMGSLVTSRTDGETYLVYDVGGPRAKGPFLKACHIKNEEENILAWSGSMYPAQVGSVLPGKWSEERIIDAFVKSYGLPRPAIEGVMEAVENRGPRTFCR